MSTELDKLYADWKSGNKAAKTSLVREMEPVVKSALRTYGGGDERLLTKARLMAVQSLDTHNPEKASLSTHLHNQLKGLYRVRAERQNITHVPENTRMDRVHIQNFMNEWKSTHGFDPDPLTISDQMGINPNRIRKALGYSSVPSSLMQSDKGDAIGVKERTPMDVWRDYVYYDQDPVGRKIMEWSQWYGSGKAKSVNEQADKLRMTPAAVSQRRKKILEQLAEADVVLPRP